MRHGSPRLRCSRQEREREGRYKHVYKDGGILTCFQKMLMGMTFVVPSQIFIYKELHHVL